MRLGSFSKNNLTRQTNKSVTIQDVTKSVDDFWTVTFVVHFKSGAGSPYDEGINKQFVLLTQQGDTYTVTGLTSQLPPKHYDKPVLVTIDPNCQNLKLAEAVKTYFEQSDPTLYQSFAIKDVVKDSANRWTVTFVLHHQPGKGDAYNEGQNIRFIDFTQQGDIYAVTGLATGMPPQDGSILFISNFSEKGYVWSNAIPSQSSTTLGTASGKQTTMYQAYQRVGDITSPAIACKSCSKATVSWVADLPNGTGIDVAIRGSNDSSHWTDWQVIKNSGDVINFGGSVSKIQFQIHLFSKDLTTNPVFRTLAIQPTN